MKNFKVKSLIDNFKDTVENTTHNKGDEFYCTGERYLFLKEHNAVELLYIEIEEEELKENVENKDGLLTEEEVKELKEDEVIDVVVNNTVEEKPKKQNTKKK